MSALRTVRISETRTLRFAEKGECNAEIDNHADTTVMGRDSLVVGDSSSQLMSLDGTQSRKAKSSKQFPQQ